MLERDYSLDSKQIKMNTSKNMNDSMDSLNTINIPNPLLDIRTEKKEDQKVKTYEMLIKGVDLKSYLADFRDKDDSKHSESYIDLKTALSECADVVRDINAGKFTWTSENYNSFNRLYEAVSRYVNDHMDARSKDGKKRLDSAINLKLALYNMSSEILWQEGVKTDIEKTRYDSKELDAARDNVKRLIKYYRAYCTRIGNEIIPTDEEKLRRKWNVLKSCEQDIRIYLDSKFGKKLSTEAAYLKAEYYSLRNQMLLRELATRKGEKQAFTNSYLSTIEDHEKLLKKDKIEDNKESLVKQEDGLTKQQVAALSKIDTWVVRNFRNGGYFGMFKCDRTDIIGRLFSMDRRKRMYIYYLVETKQRLAPSAEGLICSQLGYVPDVDVFKDRMIANKLKFYSRFSGGYVYWNKLTEAIAIAEQASPVLKDIKDFLDEEAKEEKKKLKKAGNILEIDDSIDESLEDSKISEDKPIMLEKDENPNDIIIIKNKKINVKKPEKYTKEELEQAQEVLRKQLISSSVKAIRYLQSNLDKKSKKKNKAPVFNENAILLQNYEVSAARIAANMSAINNALEAKKASAAKKSKDVKDYLGGMPKDINGVANILQLGLGDVTNNALTNGIPLPKFDFEALKNGDFKNVITKGGSLDPSADQIKSMADDYKIGTTGLKAIGNLVGAIFIAKSTIEDYSFMNRWDVTANTGDFVVSGTKLLQNITKIYGLVFSETSFVKFMAHDYTNATVGVADVIIAIVKAASHRRNAKQRIKASEIAGMKAKKDKYTEGMLRLNRKLGWKQKADTFTSGATATAVGATSLLIATSVITAATGGLALGIIGAAAFGVGIIKRSISSQLSKGMKMELFDNFFKTDDAVKKVKSEWKLNHPGKRMTKDQEERITNQVRRRISADLGFYSPTHAAKSVAVEYAKYLMDNSLAGKANMSMCRAMIKGLGLQLKFDEDGNITVPTQSDIVKKLCG